MYTQGKAASLSDLLFSKKIDILVYTETYLRPHDIAACITVHSCGVDIWLSDHFKVNSRLIPDYSTFESIMC